MSRLLPALLALGLLFPPTANAGSSCQERCGDRLASCAMRCSDTRCSATCQKGYDRCAANCPPPPPTKLPSKCPDKRGRMMPCPFPSRS